MTRTHRFGPWVAIVLAGLVAALSIAAALVLAHTVDNQNMAQLQSQAQQLTRLAQTTLVSTGPQLQTLDAVAQATNNSASAFKSEVDKLHLGPTSTVAIVQDGKALLAAGPGLTSGQTLPPVLAAAAAGSHTGLYSPGVVDLAGHRVAVIVVGSGQSGRAVLEYGPVFDKPLPALTKQTGFPNLNFALYASSKASPNQIIITTAKTPFSGTVVKTTVPVGTSKWLVETSATAPLAGTWPNAFPWIMLVAGLTLAVVLGVLVTVLGRRERYAQELVAERTADLEMAQEEIVHRERLSAVGEMATMIGHELRNPLGAAINGLYLVRHNLGDHMEPPVQRGLDLAERETQRAAALADDLTAYMRERRPALEHIPLGTAVDEVLEATPPPAGIEVRVENRDVAVDADSAQLTQMLNNCVTNAYQAMPEGGLVTVGAAASDGHVEILVDDTGPGFEPSTEFRAFDPFFTTKAQGTGLGLAIVQRVAEAHGGSVSLENRDAGGARVVIRLPSADAKAGEAS